ncbi:hypothetical protein VNI00_004282 [Paramarasmius palmivorus]|uniref:Uncharacterized protein n=1 Tax=Paramarasmius palmivorus TaxID=297713 RepID=A0AAW0DRB7_9AGAR
MTGIKLKFAPPNGQTYEKGDFKALCRSTPIPYGSLPRYLANPFLYESLCPPRLWCGWLVGEKALYDLVVNHYPEERAKSGSGEHLACDIPFLLPDIVRALLKVPAALGHLVDVIDAAKPDGEFDYALVVGNNYEGLLPRQDILSLGATMFESKPPEWFLNNRCW